MKSFQLVALAALPTLTATGALGFQGEEYPQPPAPFQSTQSRAEVRTQALNPVKISNGGTGVLNAPSTADRATVRAGAIAIAPQGAGAYGEISDAKKK